MKLGRDKLKLVIYSGIAVIFFASAFALVVNSNFMAMREPETPDPGTAACKWDPTLEPNSDSHTEMVASQMITTLNSVLRDELKVDLLDDEDKEKIINFVESPSFNPDSQEDMDRLVAILYPAIIRAIEAKDLSDVVYIFRSKMNSIARNFSHKRSDDQAAGNRNNSSRDGHINLNVSIGPVTNALLEIPTTADASGDYGFDCIPRWTGGGMVFSRGDGLAEISGGITLKKTQGRSHPIALKINDSTTVYFNPQLRIDPDISKIFRGMTIGVSHKF